MPLEVKCLIGFPVLDNLLEGLEMLNFPKYDEIPLLHPPIAEVICQVRFPPILRIANEQPVEFQEQVREMFPSLEINKGIVVQMDPVDSTPPLTEPKPRIFRFKSLDENTTVSLAPNFFALSTTSYTNWENFLAHLRFVSDTAHSIYRIPYATRIGLRYLNRLTLENTHSDSVADLWSVLRDEVTVLWQTESWQEPVEAATHLVLRQSSNERLTLRVTYRSQEEPLCFLDIDCYAEGQLPIDGVVEQCRGYHDLIYSAFRWCIREDMLAVFGAVSNSNGDG